MIKIGCIIMYYIQCIHILLPATITMHSYMHTYVVQLYVRACGLVTNLNLHICSHVMTFFDRKVDLAQFPSDHPLYVMCRAWMRNDPSGSSEEPVRPVSPQVVTVHTCMDSTYICVHNAYVCTSGSLSSLFIRDAVCMHMYVHITKGRF